MAFELLDVGLDGLQRFLVLVVSEEPVDMVILVAHLGQDDVFGTDDVVEDVLGHVLQVVVVTPILLEAPDGQSVVRHFLVIVHQGLKNPDVRAR